jgi:hypothetical protein
MDIIKTLIQIIFIGAIIFAVGFSMNIGMKNGEEQECKKWLQESKEYGNIWYSTSWQKVQCQQYGITFSR